MKWETVQWGDNNYVISSEGTVKNTKTDRFINPFTTKVGTLSISMSKTGGKSTFSLAKLVYETFIGHLGPHECPGFKDDNPKNCSVENLVKTTRSEAINKGRGITPWRERRKTFTCEIDGVQYKKSFHPDDMYLVVEWQQQMRDAANIF
jgi:hypothetical protein